MNRQSQSYITGPLALLCLAQLMCILDISIVNIAIPSIQQELALPPASVQWVMTSYVLTYGGFLLVGGRLGDLLGRRRMLLFGLGVFTLSSVVGGASGNAGVLLAARAGQGLGGAIITPTVISFITSMYSEGSLRNRALGLLGAVSGAGFALGLVLGGWLTNDAGWRWVFFINVPIGALVMILAVGLLAESKRAKEPVNAVGAALATGGLGLGVFALTVSDLAELLSWRTAASLAGSALLLTTFARTEKRARRRLIPAGMLRHAPLARALVGSITFGAIVNPSTLLLTFYMQTISGFDPLRTGFAFLPQEATVFLSAYVAGRAVGRIGATRSMMAGMAAFSAGSLWLANLPLSGDYALGVFPGLLFLGLGIGSVNVAGSIAATEGLPPSEHGASTGIWNTGTQIGTAFGLAILTSVANGYAGSLARAMPDVGSADATALGFRLAFLVAAALALAGIAVLWRSERVATRRVDDA